jgi:hypothetical protein
LTRDNLEKRKKLDDTSCLFCNEAESVHHLFFDCVVAKQTWCLISEVVGVDLGDSFESIGTCWLSNKRRLVTNIVSSATYGVFGNYEMICAFRMVHGKT